MFVPGILLKANLFGDRERKNNQDRSNNDGKFAVSVPVAADCTICFMSHCSYHCNEKQKQQELPKKKDGQTDRLDYSRVPMRELTVNCCTHARDLAKSIIEVTTIPFIHLKKRPGLCPETGRSRISTQSASQHMEV